MIPNKNHKKISGIYCIKNNINNKVYIGKSIDIWKRIYTHLSSLKKENIKSTNIHFISAFKKYGNENFEYFIVEVLPKDDNILKERELYWINVYDSTNREKGYNLRMDSSTKMICNKETSIKISKRLKKEWETGVRKNHSVKLSENWKLTPERNKKQSELFSKTLTKQSYNIYDCNNNFIENCLYKRLIDLNLKNVLATFYKKKINKVRFKNYIIEKIINKDIV